MAALSKEWWEQGNRKSDDALQGLKHRFDRADSQASVRKELDVFFESLYYDRTYAGFSSGSTMDLLVSNIQDKLNENVIQRIVSSLSAKFARQKPKPVLLTDGADWCLQRKAKRLEKWVWGALQQCRIYEEQRSSDLEMLLKGTGIILSGSRGGKLYCEVVPPEEIKVDTGAARYGKPREIYRQQAVDRRMLMRQHPRLKSEIEHSSAVSPEDAFNASGSYDSDMVKVVTGWRLPSFEGAGDGGVIVATDRCVLSAAEWCRDRFPLSVAKFMLAPRGWFGVGVVQALVGLQLELNRLNLDRQEAVHLLSAPYVLCQEGSIVASHFNNEIGHILELRAGAQPPQLVTPSPISPAMFEHGERVKSGMFQQAGVSEMATQGFKPAGVNSGRAIRAYLDMVDDAIHDVFLRREQQILDVAENLICEAEELSESYGYDNEDDSEENDSEERDSEESDDEESKTDERTNRERRRTMVSFAGPRGIEKLDFDDVKMAKEDYILTMKPASDLSTTLSGKLEDLEDLRQLGIVTDPAEMQELIQMPDLETAANRRNSMRDLLLQTIEEKILEEGRAITPEPTWDLKLAFKLCMATRWRVEMMRNPPEDRITLLRRFEKNCAYYIKLAEGNPVDSAEYEMPQQAAEQQPPLDMGLTEAPPVGVTLPGDVQPGVALAPEGMPIPGATG